MNKVHLIVCWWNGHLNQLPPPSILSNVQCKLPAIRDAIVAHCVRCLGQLKMGNFQTVITSVNVERVCIKIRNLIRRY